MGHWSVVQVLTKYEWQKMKRYACQKCSLFLKKTAFLVGISFILGHLYFVRALTDLDSRLSLNQTIDNTP